MKKILKNIVAICTVSLLLFSCQKLDVSSPNDVPTDQVFKNADGLRSALTGMYNNLQQRDYYGAYYPLMADLNSDVCTAGGFDIPALNEVGDHAITNSNLFVERMYLAMYKCIANANEIIAVVDGINDINLTAVEKKSIKGQALAIRAMVHFDVLRMYGYHWDNASAYGIPVVTTVQKATDIVLRSTVAASYTAIIKDLTDANTLLTGTSIEAKYASQLLVKGLLARVYLYQKDYVKAALFATEVINDGTYSLLGANAFTTIYSGRLSSESIFELSFDAQNQSSFNGTTYVRADALRTEVFFLASQQLNTFFEARPTDKRVALADFTNNDVSIQPEGRSQKYRGEVTKDNPAYILRIAEMYLIAAEAKKLAGGGLEFINTLRENRGMDALTNLEVADEAAFLQIVLDERLSELNFEGHRFFDLARFQKIQDVLGVSNINAVFPIPLREILATNQKLIQNPGF